MEFLASTTKQEKIDNSNVDWKRKLSLITYDMVLYVKNSKESTKQLLKLKANLAKSWIHITIGTSLRHYSHYMKEARHKKLHVIWPHKNSETGKTIQRWKKWGKILLWGKGLTDNGNKGTFWGERKILYVNRGVEYVSVWIGQNNTWYT